MSNFTPLDTSDLFMHSHFDSHLGNTFRSVQSVDEVKMLLEPLLAIETRSKQEMVVDGRLQSLKKGRYKKRIWAQFEVVDVSRMRIPTRTAMQVMNSMYDYFLIYQWQAIPRRFDILLSHCGYIRDREYETAVMLALYNIIGHKNNLQAFSFNKSIKNTSEVSIKGIMMLQAGYQLQHMLVDSYRQRDMQTEQSQANTRMRQLMMTDEAEDNASSGDHHLDMSHDFLAAGAYEDHPNNFSTSQIITRRGKIFDIHEFARGCIKVLENLLFFTQNQTIRSLQLETNTERQVHLMRLLDHRQLLQALWKETLDFALSRPGMEELSTNFSQEQIALLYNCNRHAIMTTFNMFALGQTTVIAQPHPVRALLDHIPFLMTVPAFDFSWYNFNQYGMNTLVTAYYIGKNFLTADQYMSNNQGAICFNGVPGSGKSRMSAVLFEFMNGFTYQDSTKGITEFQNFDIVTKSFIRAEEVNLKRLPTSDWKMLADLEVSIKCRVKNQQDVEVTKNVPVVITSNGDVYGDIITKAYDDTNVGAALRRWGFIRFFDSWGQQHPEIMDTFGAAISLEFQSLYSGKSHSQQVMNSLIGCALAFPRSTYVVTDYNIQYYTHCLVQLSQTLFGQILLKYQIDMQSICSQAINTYQTQSNKNCIDANRQANEVFTKILQQYVYGLYQNNDTDSLVFDIVYDFASNQFEPIYMKCLRLTQTPCIQVAIKKAAPQILKAFLIGNMQYTVYAKIMKQIEEQALGCTEVLDSQRNRSLSDSMDIVMETPMLARPPTKGHVKNVSRKRSDVLEQGLSILDDDYGSVRF